MIAIEEQVLKSLIQPADRHISAINPNYILPLEIQKKTSPPNLAKTVTPVLGSERPKHICPYN
jgi:hypothetical protein